MVLTFIPTFKFAEVNYLEALDYLKTRILL